MSAQLAQALKELIASLDFANEGCEEPSIGPGYENGDGIECGTRIAAACADGLAALAAFEAAPQQEPVAWLRDFWGPDCGPFYEIHKTEDMTWRDKESWIPLYAAPQQAQAPIDPDGEQSRAGFRAFDEAQVALWATPWQVWREAVKWASQQAQAPGWQLVPVYPTTEMLDAGRWSEYGEDSSRLRAVDDDEVAGVWALMLKAAPKKGE